MRNTLKDLAKRVARLEQPSPPSVGLVGVESFEEAERKALLPGECIVQDHYQDAAGKTVMICERITIDPADKGKRFSHGCWDRGPLERLYRQPRKDIRIFWATNPPAGTDLTQSELV